MGNNDLQADPNGANSQSILGAILGALRGTLYPRKTNGQLHTGGGLSAPNLGSPSTPFHIAYLDQVVVGGAPLNLASLVKGTTVSVFAASDRSFSWPYGQSSAMAIIAGAESGGGGGEGGRGFGGSDASTGGDDGLAGSDGGASNIAFSGATYSSGTAVGGIPGNNTFLRHRNRIGHGGPSSANGGAAGKNTAGASMFPVANGEHGYQSIQTHFINGLFVNALLNITVSQAVGAGGAGGAGGSGSTRNGGAGGRGDNGALLGYVILIPIGA